LTVSTRPRALGLLLASVLVFVAVAPRPALGCSCIEPIDPGGMFDEASAAFVGTMMGRQDVDEFETDFLFEVEEWVKSDQGGTVWIRSGSNGAMCGFEQPTGQRIGLLAYFDGEHLTSGLCSMLDPDVLMDLRDSHQAGPGAVEPLRPGAIGPPDQEDTATATNTARVALGVLATAALAGVLASRWRRRSSPEQ
jgi:hypothetical protein